MAAFNQYIKLTGVLAYALRTLYSINKSRLHLGFVGESWEAGKGMYALSLTVDGCVILNISEFQWPNWINLWMDA